MWKMRRLVISIPLVFLWILLTGCSDSSITTELPTDTPVPAQPSNTPVPPTNTPIPEITSGDPERGREIFENGGENEASTSLGSLCSNCHTLDGSDEKTQNGPDLQGISERAGKTVPGLSAAQYIHQSIMDPRAYVVEDYSYMSAAPSRLFSEDEIADLVAFLLTQ